MEDNTIEEYIETIAELFQAITAKYIEKEIIDKVKEKYGLIEKLTPLPIDLFDDYKEHRYIQKNYKSFGINDDPNIVLFIASIRIISKHPKFYEAKEIRFYFSNLLNIVKYRLNNISFISSMLIHLYQIGQNELQEIVTTYLSKSFYGNLVKLLKKEIENKKQEILKETRMINVNAIIKYDYEIQKLDFYYQKSRLEKIWNLYQSKYMCDRYTESFNSITYNDLTLFQRIITNDYINKRNELFFLEIQLYKDIKKTHALIMKSESIRKFYTEKKFIDERTRNNYYKFIEFITSNDNKIPISAIDKFIVLLTLDKEYHGMNSDYQRIAINISDYCFEIEKWNNEEIEEKGYGDLSIEETFYTASLIMIFLHEYNHFLRNHEVEPQIITTYQGSRDNIETKFIIEIFGVRGINYLPLKIAKRILDPETWKEKVLQDLFNVKHYHDYPLVKYMRICPSGCGIGRQRESILDYSQNSFK